MSKPVTQKKATKKPRGTAAPGKPAKQKQVASPISTGGRGFTFERRVQAVHLVAMCLGMHVPGIAADNIITKLTFQGRVLGHNTDDIVVDFVSPQGEPGTLRVQLKRSLTAKVGNKVFIEAVGLAWLDFKDPGFRKGRDVLMIAYLPPSAPGMEEMRELTRQAIGTTLADDWKMKALAERFSNNDRRNAFSALEAAAKRYNNSEAVELVELHQFAIHLKFQHYDLDSDTTREVSTQQTWLSIAASQRSAEDQWTKLVSVCGELNDVAGDVDLNSIERHIGADLTVAYRVWRATRDSLKVGTSTAQTLRPAGIATDINAVAAPLVSSTQASSFVETAPPSRESSHNKLVSRLLDEVNGLQKELRYREASERLASLGQDFKEFDTYQQALWHLLRGMCRWHLSDDSKGAAEDFLRAAELNDDGPKFAAARIRGHLMLEQVEQALKAGADASARFPSAYEVWVAHANARVINGAVLEETDIPPEFRELAIAWQIVAGSQERARNLLKAFELARTGASKPDASFFTKEALLRYALQEASDNSVNVGLRALPPEQTARLRISIDAFTPRVETLWVANQSPRTLEAAVAHLGFAYILVGQPQASLDLMAEARSRAIEMNGTDLRIELEAQRDLGNPAEVLRSMSGRLHELPNEALASFAQIAANSKDEAQLTAAVTEAATRASQPDGENIVRMLRNTRWEFMLQTGRSVEVSSETRSAGIDVTSTSIIDLMFAIRSAPKGGDGKKEVSKLIDRVIELTKTESDPAGLHVAAQILHRYEHYEEATAVYTRILPPQTCSRLHADLLDCYMHLGQTGKAKALVQSLPPSWEEDSSIRALAMNLALSARDWHEVSRFAKLERSQHPERCYSWLISLTAAAHCDAAQIGQLIADAPLRLEGSPQEQAHLASIEVQYGQSEKALLRLYAMRRSRLGEAETAALHLRSVLLPTTDATAIGHTPEVVRPGTCVAVTAEDGTTRYWSIDPSELDDLPSTDEFLGPQSAEAKQLLSKKVGDYLEIGDLFGGSRKFQVSAIISVHRRLLDLSHLAIQAPLAPTKALTSIQMARDDDGSPNLDAIREQLESRAQQAHQTLDIYKQHRAPLGIIAKQLGTDTIDLMRGWPQAGPKLEIVSNWLASSLEADELIHKAERWVVDLSMLTELVILGQQHLLGFLPEVYVATAVRDVVQSKLEANAVFRKSGTMFTADGKLGFHENSEKDWQRDREFLLAMAKCIETHCKVEPAYGPTDIEPNLVRIRQVLSEDEYATLLLSLQLNTSVLSQDDRFRQICKLLGRTSAWTEPLFESMLMDDHMSVDDYMLSTLKLMLARRTFVPISHFELFRLMAMDDDFIQFGINSLRDYLSDSSVDFASAEQFLFSTLKILHLPKICTFELCKSLLEHLAEGLFRHPRKPEGWFAACVYQAWVSLGIQARTGQQQMAELITQSEARALLPPKSFTLDLVGLDRKKLPLKGESENQPSTKGAAESDQDILTPDLS